MSKFLHWLGGPFRLIRAIFALLLVEEGRRAWAVIVAFGCGVTMTAYATWVLWLVRQHAMLVFWLGLCAMFIVVVVITAFTGLLIKREIGGSVSKDGGSFTVKDQ